MEKWAWLWAPVFDRQGQSQLVHKLVVTYLSDVEAVFGYSFVDILITTSCCVASELVIGVRQIRLALNRED